ncbi:MAG: hypothetical protein NTV63_00800 [Candidatus Woesearchaeota archaeon]|nr:hypothetical protein [Candidatus Woesearchaeota archaeon]
MEGLSESELESIISRAKTHISEAERISEIQKRRQENKKQRKKGNNSIGRFLVLTAAVSAIFGFANSGNKSFNTDITRQNNTAIIEQQYTAEFDAELKWIEDSIYYGNYSVADQFADPLQEKIENSDFSKKNIYLEKIIKYQNDYIHPGLNGESPDNLLGIKSEYSKAEDEKDDERVEAEKKEAERIATEKREAERVAAEKKEAERSAAEKKEAARIATEKIAALAKTQNKTNFENDLRARFDDVFRIDSQSLQQYIPSMYKRFASKTEWTQLYVMLRAVNSLTSKQADSLATLVDGNLSNGELSDNPKFYMTIDKFAIYTELKSSYGNYFVKLFLAGTNEWGEFDNKKGDTAYKFLFGGN